MREGEAFYSALESKDFEKAVKVVEGFVFHANEGWLYKEAIKFKGTPIWREVDDFMSAQFAGWAGWVTGQNE